MTKKEIQDIRPGDIIFNMSKREAYKIQEVHEGYVTYEGVPHAGSFPKTSLEKWDMVSLMRDREEPQTKEEKTGKEVELTHFEGELFSVISDFWQSYMKGEEVNVVNFVKEHSPSLLEAAHEWSEEDGNNLNRIAAILVEGSYSHPWWSKEKLLSKDEMRKLTDWLKSFCPQPKAEWSEEDEKMLASFLHKVEVCDLLTNKENAWIVERLKSLRPQPKAEWSEEDKGILLECISVLQNSSHWLLADKLKSLRPQPHWKPSEEQMKFLKRTVDGWDITCRGQGALESLYVDLQKLLEP